MAYLSSFTNAEAYSKSTEIAGIGNFIFKHPLNSCTWGNHCEISATTVIAVYNEGGTGGGTVVIGEVISDACIEWGTPVVFDSTGASYIIPVRVADDKFMIFYKDDGDTYAKARGGTISGTVPTLGNTTTVNAAASTPIGAVLMDTDKIMLAYANSTTNGQAKIYTMSGANGSVGSSVTFKATTDISAYTTLTQLCSHSTTLATVVYRVSATVTQCVTLTFDGNTTITANTGGLAAFGGTADIRYPSIGALSATSFALAYTDVTDTNKGNCQIGTISSTTITAGASEYNFDSSNDASGYRRPILTIVSSTLFAVVYAVSTQYVLQGRYCSVAATVVTMLDAVNINSSTPNYDESIGTAPIRINAQFGVGGNILFSYLTRYNNGFVCGSLRINTPALALQEMKYLIAEAGIGEQVEISSLFIAANNTNFSTSYKMGLYFNGTTPSNRFYYGGYSDQFTTATSAPCIPMTLANDPIILTSGQKLYASFGSPTNVEGDMGNVTVFGVKRS